jgi:hypothetical protein
MRSRASKWTTTVAAAILLSCLAGTTPAVAGAEQFHLKFKNESGALLRVAILYSSKYQVQKDAEVSPGKAHTFEFGIKCKNTHVRRFKIWELVTDKSAELGAGQFTMATGRAMGDFKVDCRNPTFTMDTCKDSSVSDGFDVSCKEDADGTVSVLIE